MFQKGNRSHHSQLLQFLLEKKNCCEKETCSQFHPATSSGQISCTYQHEHFLERSVSDTELFRLKKKLLPLKLCLFDYNSLISSDLFHGLIYKIIDDIVKIYYTV